MDTVGFLLGILAMVFFTIAMAICIALCLTTAAWLQQWIKESRRARIWGESRTTVPFPLPKAYLWLVACALSLLALYLVVQWGIAREDRIDQKTNKGGSMRTVRELKNQVQAEAGGEMQSLSPACGKFWAKLNRLGFERRTCEPEHCADIDATAPVSAGEYEELLVEFRSLPKTWFN